MLSCPAEAGGDPPSRGHTPRSHRHPATGLVERTADSADRPASPPGRLASNYLKEPSRAAVVDDGLPPCRRPGMTAAERFCLGSRIAYGQCPIAEKSRVAQPPEPYPAKAR